MAENVSSSVDFIQRLAEFVPNSLSNRMQQGCLPNSPAVSIFNFDLQPDRIAKILKVNEDFDRWSDDTPEA